MKKNITAELTRNIILKNPFLIEFLNRKIINTTSLARELLPRIQKQNQKATVESISVALQRLQLPTKTPTNELQKILSSVQLTMRTDVSLFCLKTAPTVPLDKFSQNDIFFINQGSDETTIIVDRKNKSLIQGDILFSKDNLALLSIKDTLMNTNLNYRITPGFMNLFVSNISMQGINIEDMISSYSQLTFVIEEKYLSQVYQICKGVKEMKYF